MRRTLHTAIITAAAVTLAGCIVEFMPDVEVEEFRLLSVEGNIVDGDTVISLNWSQALRNSGPPPQQRPATNARVRVESEPGGSFESVELLEGVQIYDEYSGEPLRIDSVPSGWYRIRVGTLDDNIRYRLSIAIEGEEYVSGWRRPVSTPPIGEIDFYKERDRIQVRLDLTGEEGGPEHFVWSYEETWETQADVHASYYFGKFEGDYGFYSVYDYRYTNEDLMIFAYPEWRSPFYYCWKYNNSKELLLASTELLAENALRDHVLIEFPASNDRLSSLYHLKLHQHAVGEDAYHYLMNMKKNTDEMGSIFTPVPSELKGNMVCTTNPENNVIGFVDVSRRVEHQLFLDTFDSPYERPPTDCRSFNEETLMEKSGQWGGGQTSYTPYTLVEALDPARMRYSEHKCIDCRMSGGGKIRPSWWPNDHY